MLNTVRDIDLLKTWCLSGTLNFTRYFFLKKFNRKFVVGDHHKQISDVLDRVLSGELKKVIINIAPRYGKTEIAVKNFIAEGLALNPKAKFIHLSYSDDLVRDNSSGVQEIMGLPEYKRLFDAKPTSTNSKKWYTEQGGGLYAVSSAGQVTGFGAGLVDEESETEKADIDEFMPGISADENFGGAIIIDDPIKPDDALSPKLREKVNNKFDSTIRNRVNSRKTPIIIIMQRVHEQDLCGYLISNEPGEWHVLSLPCIYTDKQGNEQSLWPFKHTLDELRKLRQKNSFVFDTQYMQNPKPAEGYLYNDLKTYQVIPMTESRKVKAYVDTADTGDNYLCSIVYLATEIGFYVIDVIYTQAPMETTEQLVSVQFSKHKVEEADIESNNGGRGFARNVEKNIRLMKNFLTKINWFHQSENKEVRIFTNSSMVINSVYFPENWDKMWPGYYSAMSGYLAKGKNEFDDGPDATTGIIEKNIKTDSVQAGKLASMFH